MTIVPVPHVERLSAGSHPSGEPFIAFSGPNHLTSLEAYRRLPQSDIVSYRDATTNSEQ